MSSTSLPAPLLLLVHLHLLNYPNANSPEYDHNLFNPRLRGLRDRARTMEDVAYFLVGKVEGKSVKAILSSYPCSQPSASLAFRTSLTKYLEQLRHRCIYPKDGSEAVDWWKDVVVRKSLIEECSGEKFERLMLSLSTFALMKIANTDLNAKSKGLSQSHSLSSLVRTQPIEYTINLARYHSGRHSWTRAASLLCAQERDLRTVKARINSTSAAGISDKTSPFDALPTPRILALAASKLSELKSRYWTTDTDATSLTFLLEAAGCRAPNVFSGSNSGLDSRLASIFGSASTSTSTSASQPQPTPSPLPIAAAHHPAHLKKLRRPVFASVKVPTSTEAGTSTSEPTAVAHATIVLSAQISAEKRMRTALGDALSRVKKRVEHRTGKLAKSAVSSPPSRPDSESNAVFWIPPSSSSDPHLTFVLPEPTGDLLVSLGFQADFDIISPAGGEDGGGDERLEKRIEEIRTVTLRGLYTTPHPRSAERLPPRDWIGHSKIPVAAPSSKTSTKASKVAPPSTPAPSTTVKFDSSPSKGSPSKTGGRKSVRFSIATATARRKTGRMSMFRVFSDEVDRLVDETHDFPTTDDDSDRGSSPYRSPSKTPRSKNAGTPKSKTATPKSKQKVNRIWTAGTPRPQSRATPRSQARASEVLQHLFDSDTDTDGDVFGGYGIDSDASPPARSSMRPSVGGVGSGGRVKRGAKGLPSLDSLSEVEKLRARLERGDREMELTTDADDTDDDLGIHGANSMTPKPTLSSVRTMRIQGSGRVSVAPLRYDSQSPVEVEVSAGDDDENEVDVGEAEVAGDGDDDGYEGLAEDYDEYEEEEEMPSMTLKDILLNTDTGDFDLLDDSVEDEGMLNDHEDGSFLWDRS